ncbi:MAG: hypothetical protein A2144_00965 [Chloroflexi bacterium RBG_16_50_9]|nr:MAG: hypothetical protein A2144_00965 [Chloroflexi bacterium RBG_16_50_9]
MTEVIPRVHWLKLPLDMVKPTPPHVNAYLIQGDRGYLLVDTGWGTDETLDSVKKHLAAIGADFKDISQIIVTHIHPDHYGLAGKIKQLSGAKLAFHEIEKGFIESRYIHMENLLSQTAHLLGMNGVPPDELPLIKNATLGLEQFVSPVNPDVTFRGGETIAFGEFTFKILLTPGHSLGHVCLYEPKKGILICGDHILPTITPNTGRHPQSDENPLKSYLDSLNDMKNLGVDLVLPGHESPFDKFETRVNELIQHHKERNHSILVNLKREPQTAYQIARGLVWGIAFAWPEMPAFHKRLAISETLAHLTFMVDDGRLKQIARDGMIYYRQN